MPIVITAWSTGASASQALEQEAAAAELDERAVERDVELDQPLGRRALLRGTPRTRRRTRLDVRARAGAAAHRRRLELVPHAEQVVEVLGAEAHGDHAPVRARLDEALALQHLQRAAHGPAADRELGGELRLHERRALGERAVDDRLAQLPGDPARVDAAGELDRVLADRRGQRIVFENC